MCKTNYKKREPGERDNTVSIFKMHQRYRQKIEKSWGDLKLLTSGSVSLGSDNDQFSPTFSIFSSDEHMAQYFPQTRLMDCH